MRHFYHSVLAALLIAAAAPAARAAEPLYSLAATVPLGGTTHWDYAYFRAASGQLFIAHGDVLTVVDTVTDKITGNVTSLADSHGTAFDPATGLGYTDSSGTRTLSVFDPATLKVEKTLPSLDDTDGMVFDPATRKIFVAAGDSAAVLALDPASDTETKIMLGGKPEFLTATDRGQLFVALSDKNEMARVDTQTGQVTAHWALPGCEAPTGMAMDTVADRVFTSCQNGKLTVIDGQTGEETALLPIGKGSDSIAFDAKRHLIFSANSDGTLSIIRETDPDHYAALPPLRTRLGARTLAVDEATGAIFLVTAKVKTMLPPRHAGWAPRYSFQPNTLTLLIYRPVS